MDLKELALMPGVSGFENRVRESLFASLREKGFEPSTDVLGNVIVKTGGGGPRVMIDAHMDEVGLMVTAIEKNGLIKFQKVGGIDDRVLLSKRVFIGKDRVPGVIGAKAIHLQEPKEREQVIPWHALAIDVGAKSREEAEKKVKVGDYIVFDTEYEEIGTDVVKSKALDDRIGCAVLLRLLEEKWEKVELYCVFSVQEEVGTRGARVAAHRIEPDMGIAVEGTVCADLPGLEDHQWVTRLGGGAAVSVMDRGSIPSRRMVDELLRLARENGIPVQFRESTAGGNDAAAMQLARSGCPVASVSVPCRYIHSPASLASRRDFENVVKLLTLFLRSVEGGFRP